MSIYDYAYKLFKPIIKQYKSFFSPLDSKLKIARIHTSVEKYSAIIIFTGAVAFIVSLVFALVFGTLAIGFKLIYLLIYLLLSMFIGVVSAAFMYLYPNFVISERRTKIDNSLPFISIYLSTIAKSGFPPQEMFKLLADFKDYRAVADEAKKINTDVRGLGVDLPTALTRAMNRSPSPDWTELLIGLRNSITVGGEVSKYLEEKSRGFIQSYKRRLQEFSRVLTLFMNIYITVVIVGLVFFIVISSLMATIGGISVPLVKTVQYIIVFVGLPMLTAGFILLIKGASPWAN